MTKFVKNMRVVSNTPQGESCSLMLLTPADGKGMPSILPGQFVQVECRNSKSTYLRRPVSVNDVDYGNNTLSLLIRRAGDGTRSLCDMSAGESLSVVLPLGTGFPTDVENRRVLLIGGGVGVAPLLFYGKLLKALGVNCKFVLGARSKSDLLLLDKFESVAEVEVATEDGSAGTHGFVTLCPALSSDGYDLWAVCGPMPMMRAVASLAKARGVECFVSLENKMACGLGACLCCVENTVTGHQCVCTSGPVFNANELLW